MPLKVTDQDAPDGRPLSVNVTEGSVSTSAVIEPGPPIVAIVDEPVPDTRVFELFEEDQEEKR